MNQKLLSGVEPGIQVGSSGKKMGVYKWRTHTQQARKLMPSPSVHGGMPKQTNKQTKAIQILPPLPKVYIQLSGAGNQCKWFLKSPPKILAFDYACKQLPLKFRFWQTERKGYKQKQNQRKWQWILAKWPNPSKRTNKGKKAKVKADVTSALLETLWRWEERHTCCLGRDQDILGRSELLSFWFQKWVENQSWNTWMLGCDDESRACYWIDDVTRTWMTVA